MSPVYEHIIYQVVDRVAIITLNRPAVRNAISRKMTYELDAAFRTACTDPAVRVLLLNAAGDNFCSGHDLGSKAHLSELASPPQYEPGVSGDVEKWSELDVEMCLRCDHALFSACCEWRGAAGGTYPSRSSPVCKGCASTTAVQLSRVPI